MISHLKTVAEFVSEVWWQIISVIMNNRAFVIFTAFINHSHTCNTAKVPAAQLFLVLFA